MDQPVVATNAAAGFLYLFCEYIKEERHFMRRFQKQQILDIFTSLHMLHKECRTKLEQQDNAAVQTALSDCQTAAIQIGEAIEQLEGEGTVAVACLEQYCEKVYQITTQLSEIHSHKVYKMLEDALIKAENEVKHLPARIEAVFLPYKASMWDSLESVWMAADADPNCDAYVIPIPYYDKNPDGSFKEMHYEADQYPDYVPVTHYNDYNFEQRRPDMIYIHNPYDQFNNVTSVHPFFYSKNLKQFTDCLVYIPYYATSGGMSEAQGYCPSYYYVDYIVVQAEKYRKFFDPNLPKEKLLPLGSPKFDKVIRLCNNPPEPPKEWKEKMAGKKVYFYNTSINGMLGNTASFLRKMEYVFKCFADRRDACLVWRPHPLLESTFASMRSEYKPVYDALKRYYLESDFGIYDDTAEITDTIALCDAYIGDAGTSVTSLFGMAGKPVFILNNYIDSAPTEDDWRGEIIKGFYAHGIDKWIVTQGNKLYYSPNDDYNYEYFCDLCGYAYGDYYSPWVIAVNGKAYVCPKNAQNILLIGKHGIDKRIELMHCIEQKGAFYGAISCGKYLFLIPNNYPAIVRYNTETGEIKYFHEHLDIFIGMKQGERRIGGYCVQNGYLFLASPVEQYVLAIHAETGKEQVMTTNASNMCGCLLLVSDGTDLWFLPYSGSVITRWNPESGEVQEYDNCSEGLKCKHPTLGYECMERPFSRLAISGNYVYLPPNWGNMYIRLDKRSGEMTEWIPPFEQPETAKNGYYISSGKSYFIRSQEKNDGKTYRLFSAIDRKLYELNLETNEYQEIKIDFALSDLYGNQPGFQENSDWLQYACQENAFNSLPDFLSENITGSDFEKARQIRSYGKNAANNDGTCGEKVYEYARNKLLG